MKNNKKKWNECDKGTFEHQKNQKQQLEKKELECNDEFFKENKTSEKKKKKCSHTNKCHR